MAKRTGGFIGQDGLNAPDPATGVTGTAGNEQVTVSWTAPSDVGGAAITGYNVQSADGSGSYSTFPLSTYTNNSFLLTGQTNNPYGVLISNDGSVMLVLDRQNSNVLQYNLSTAYDVSTASYDSALNLSSQTTQPQGFSAAKNGEKIYVTEEGSAPYYVFEYTLTTGWDVSTGSYSSNSYAINGTVASPSGIYVKNDGTKMYVRSISSDLIYQFSLSTAYDVSTASYDSKTLDVSGESTNGYSLTFLSSGYYVYVSDVNDNIYEYQLTTAWDISTGSYTGNSFDVSSQETSTLGVDFSDNGKKFYVTGQSSDTVYEYTFNDYPTASPVTITGLTNGTEYTFNVWAINPFGWSSPSDASGGVTPSLTPWAMVAGFVPSSGSYTTTIERYSLATGGDSSDFGDLTVARSQGNGMSSATRTVFAGGRNGGTAHFNTMDYVNPNSEGNASDFGDLTYGQQAGAYFGSSTRGVGGGAQGPSQGAPNYQAYDTLAYITFATTGNASDFGDLTQATEVTTGFSSPTRGVRSTGNAIIGGSLIAQNVMDYVTIASTGNATDFGDNTSTRYNPGGCASSTRGLTAGGNSGAPNYTNLNVIDYVTIASTGNATDFGDLISMNGLYVRGASSETTATFMKQGTVVVSVTIATTGNATDFGDVSAYTYNEFMATSSAHGGLQ